MHYGPIPQNPLYFRIFIISKWAHPLISHNGKSRLRLLNQKTKNKLKVVMNFFITLCIKIRNEALLIKLQLLKINLKRFQFYLLLYSQWKAYKNYKKKLEIGSCSNLLEKIIK